MVSDKILISVCIANFNGEEILFECLDSIVRQVGDFSVEIIVHDDCSTDGSLNLLHEVFPNVQVIVSKNNVGFCVANNRMVAAARGRYVLLLNNDAVLLQGALQTLLAYAESLGKQAILGLPQYAYGGGGLIDCGSDLDLFLNAVPNQHWRKGDVAVVIGACFWINKELWHELGGFPESFHALAEDTYLCCRARLAGYPVRIAPGSGFLHRVGYSLGGGKATAGELHTRVERRRLTERNKTFALLACSPGVSFFFLLPIHLLMLCLEGGGVSLLTCRYKIWRDIYLACFKALWRERRWLARFRVETQCKRSCTLVDYFSVFRILPQKFRMLMIYGFPRIS
ncbi:hypothetical protein OTERR_23980 [Oryzomicrobium terrae]|uniref:Glycosyltransferase 2-like domain-containing protein n=1 Tax=Oryzomicrobium terrae TaxID=1735038 RepID=A0A5C1EB18_9RHOO|nr:glycosyltransferase family 2 protein [Oryzomicrobium terrae]QEL65874.1 hypothetical protein OTERR_23980 [Oryzomicrobium terrae]